MEKLMMNILQVSLTVSIILMPLFCLRACLRKRYPARVLVLLWTVLSIRLLFPVQITLPDAPVEFMPGAAYRQGDIIIPLEVSTMQAAPMQQGGNQTVNGSQTENETKPFVHMTFLLGLSLIWAGVAVLLLGNTIYRGKRYRKQVLRFASPVKEQTLLQCFAEEKARLNIQRDITLLYAAEVPSPMLMGIFHPVLLLTDREMQPIEAAMVFRHELTHYKRYDLWRKALLVAARCLHWFNPLAWWLVRAAGEDIEMACDSEVVSDMDLKQKKQYGAYILDNMECQIRRQTELTTYFHGDKKGIKIRLSELFAGKKKHGIWFAVLTMALAIIFGSTIAITDGFAVNGVVKAELQELGYQWAGKIWNANIEEWYPMMTEKKAEQVKASQITMDKMYPENERRLDRFDVIPDAKHKQATIVYAWRTDDDVGIRTLERLTFKKEHGEWKVSQIDGNPLIDGKEISQAVDSAEKFLLFYQNDIGIPSAFRYFYAMGSLPEEDIMKMDQELFVARCASKQGYDLMDAQDAARFAFKLKGCTMQGEPIVYEKEGNETMCEVKFAFEKGGTVSIFMTRYKYTNAPPSYWYPVDWYVDDEHPRTPLDLAKQWGEGLQLKDGHLLLPLLTEEKQNAFVAHQQQLSGEPDGTWYWKVGGSSPTGFGSGLSYGAEIPGATVLNYWERENGGMRFEIKYILYYTLDARGQRRISNIEKKNFESEGFPVKLMKDGGGAIQMKDGVYEINHDTQISIDYTEAFGQLEARFISEDGQDIRLWGDNLQFYKNYSRFSFPLNMFSFVKNESLARYVDGEIYITAEGKGEVWRVPVRYQFSDLEMFELKKQNNTL